MKQLQFSLVLFGIFSTLLNQSVISQPAKEPFTHADTLRGSVTPERAWWDVLRYDIRVKPDYNEKSIEASNRISFRTLERGNSMQIDLQEPLEITRILWHGTSLKYSRDGNLYHVRFPAILDARKTESIDISYHGKPRIAARPPWDGGWIFTKDKLGRPWMSVACQGLGASVWYPCKDYQGDEPDNGASLAVTVPDTLVAIGNGRLRDKKNNGDGTITYNWVVIDPINNYNIIPYIGKYSSWHEVYQGEKGKLDCDFWVLDYDLDKAKMQFKQADSMLHCFEYWFGPYPFYEDGYKLVEAPHLGMEHQSAVAYGNHFQNGYLGSDLSKTGWGLKWDFIIVHESGHEWFGNNITTKDLADMWVHEGITNYSETIYTDCHDGVQAGNEYCIGTRSRIRNDRPIIAHYGVNEEGSGDMYYKGGNMIHTIRQIIADDSLFRDILRGLNHDFYHQTVTSSQIEDYISQHAHQDFSKIFDQYLRTTKIPTLEYKFSDGNLHYHWTNCVPGFSMPVKLTNGSWLKPTEGWQIAKATSTEFTVDPNFYIYVKKSE